MKGGVIMISFYNWVIPLKDLKNEIIKEQKDGE